MVNVMVTFGLSVMSFYTLCKQHFQQNEHVQNHLYSILEWFLVYLISTLIVIHMANSVTRKVCICMTDLVLKDTFVYSKEHLRPDFSVDFVAGKRYIQNCSWNNKLLHGYRHYNIGMLLSIFQLQLRYSPWKSKYFSNQDHDDSFLNL